jgi:hypothetical protein
VSHPIQRIVTVTAAGGIIEDARDEVAIYIVPVGGQSGGAVR